MSDSLLNRRAKLITIKSVATSGESPVASVASVLKGTEREALIAIAKALGPHWCVQVVPPHGQLRILPVDSREINHRCHTASTAAAAIFREDAIHPRVLRLPRERRSLNA